MFTRLKAVLILLLFCFSSAHAAVDHNSSTTKADEITIGFYINDISKLDIKDNSFQVDFYVWFLWDNDELKPYKTFELMNGQIVSQELIETKKINMLNIASKRIKATMRQNFDVTRFPLDTHGLVISFEDTMLETDKLVYVADHNNTKLDPTIHIPGYKLGSHKVNIDSKRYESNLSNSSLGTNNRPSYSRATYEVEIYRDGVGIFFKTFLGFFISFVIALTTFVIRPDHSARFSLSVGAVFASTTLFMMVKAHLPESAQALDMEKVVTAVFTTIAGEIDLGEINKLKKILPKPLSNFFPDVTDRGGFSFN